jgi:hypothetical protein
LLFSKIRKKEQNKYGFRLKSLQTQKKHSYYFFLSKQKQKFQTTKSPYMIIHWSLFKRCSGAVTTVSYCGGRPSRHSAEKRMKVHLHSGGPPPIAPLAAVQAASAPLLPLCAAHALTLNLVYFYCLQPFLCIVHYCHYHVVFHYPAYQIYRRPPVPLLLQMYAIVADYPLIPYLPNAGFFLHS